MNHQAAPPPPPPPPPPTPPPRPPVPAGVAMPSGAVQMPEQLRATGTLPLHGGSLPLHVSAAGHLPEGFAPMGGMRMPVPPVPPRPLPRQATVGADMGMPVYLNQAEQIETLIKMVLNAIIRQDDDEVMVPYGITKKAPAGKAPPPASDSRPSPEDSGQGGPAPGAMDLPADGAPGGDLGTVGAEGKDDAEGGVSEGGNPKDLAPGITTILRACLKKAEEQPFAVLKKHVNKILRAPPFFMFTGPIYYYTPETPRNELERTERTPVVRGWVYRDPLSEERVLMEGLCRIPPVYRLHQDNSLHCKAALDALDAATQVVRAVPHKKALRSRRMKGSRGFKALGPDEADKEFEPGSESWSWKSTDNGRLQWCDRKERRWFKCPQCRFMKENRSLVKKHLETSPACSEAWEQDQRTRRPEKEGRLRGRAKPRLSHPQASVVGRAMVPHQQPMPPQLPDTHIKALILIDSLLDDGTLSPKQAQKMRWLCMWRQPPIAVLMLAYGTNPELFGIRCKRGLVVRGWGDVCGLAGEKHSRRRRGSRKSVPFVWLRPRGYLLLERFEPRVGVIRFSASSLI